VTIPEDLGLGLDVGLGLRITNNAEKERLDRVFEREGKARSRGLSRIRAASFPGAGGGPCGRAN
jgi:hypothetical protein